MVWRMKRRSSMACAFNGAGRSRRERTGPAQGMRMCIIQNKSVVKYFVIQSYSAHLYVISDTKNRSISFVFNNSSAFFGNSFVCIYSSGHINLAFPVIFVFNYIPALYVAKRILLLTPGLGAVRPGE
jgi:hypothetical protein